MVVFCCKIQSAIGGIRDSEQLRTDIIWGYPEYGASNCVRHMVSPGFDGLNKNGWTIGSITIIDGKPFC